MSLVLGLSVLDKAPSLYSIGWAFLEVEDDSEKALSHGSLDIKGRDLDERQLAAHALIHDVLATYRPDLASIANAFYRKWARREVMVYINAVLRLPLAQERVPIVEAVPVLLKEALDLSPSAGRLQLTKRVNRVYNLAIDLTEPAIASAYGAAAYGAKLVGIAHRFRAR